ncbi:MAG: sulfite exporter TauE/SafE family protein [Haloarculaceae archaeon]
MVGVGHVPTPAEVAPPSPLGLVAFFLLGAFGSVHCLGMCGPLAATYAGHASGSRRRLVRLRLLFNGGRTVGYAAVGGLLGGASGLLVGVADLASLGSLVRGLVGVAAGLLILTVGVRYLRTGTAASGLGGLELPFRALTGRLLGHVERLADGPGVVGLGVVHALVPCPLLYPAYAFAFATGSALAGASALAALGLGTVPAVFVAATGGELLASAGPRAQRALGAVFVLLALLPLAHGVAALGGV